MQWQVAVTDALRDAALRDLSRTLILQNARFAGRFDPFSRFRNPRNDGRLQRVGLVACAIGWLLSLLLVGQEWLSVGHVSRSRVVLLVIFTVLMPVFAFIPQLRAGSVDRIDAMLRRRAMGALDDKWLPGQNLEWSIDGSVREDARLSQSCDGGAPVLRPLAPIRHGLLGEATLLLFPSKNALNPVIAILLPDDMHLRDDVVRACESLDIAVETLSADLLPSATPRSW
jgi:hypothetical protein